MADGGAFFPQPDRNERQSSLIAFVPPDVVSQVSALPNCPYCAAFPSVPCALHRGRDDE